MILSRKEIYINGGDEYYTSLECVDIIAKYIKPNSIIWCPFDKEWSLFVRRLQAEGYTVIYSHIDEGFDFLTCNIPECDYIISNPPFSLKTVVFRRLAEIGKPFAMLVGLEGLFDNFERASIFEKLNIEILYINPRVRYIQNINTGKLSFPHFQSAFVCYKMLPKQINFVQIKQKVIPLSEINKIMDIWREILKLKNYLIDALGWDYDYREHLYIDYGETYEYVIIASKERVPIIACLQSPMPTIMRALEKEVEKATLFGSEGKLVFSPHISVYYMGGQWFFVSVINGQIKYKQAKEWSNIFDLLNFTNCNELHLKSSDVESKIYDFYLKT